jgi:hypothetical protein
MHHLACLIVSLIRTCTCSTNSYMHAALRLTSGMSHRCRSLHPSACPPWTCSTCRSICEAMRLIPSAHESQTSSENMAIQTSHTRHVLLLRTSIGYSASLASSSALTPLRLKLHSNTLTSLQQLCPAASAFEDTRHSFPHHHFLCAWQQSQHVHSSA